MKKFILFILPLFALSLASSHAGPSDQPAPSHPNKAYTDQFTEIANSPNGYWVPAPTPVVYYPRPGYYGPPPYYYGPYYGPPGPFIYGPRVFIGFGFHGHYH